MVWFLETLREALLASDRRMDEVLQRVRLWRELGEIPLNARQLKVVRRLVEAGPDGFEGRLSTRKYVALTKASRATAQREIADLLAKGVLMRWPGGGRSTAYGLWWPGSTRRPDHRLRASTDPTEALDS